jgi:hypothetical protein
MDNKELIYEMARRLNMIIQVEKDGKYIGKYKYIDNKLHKLNEDAKEMHKMQDNKENN